MVAGEHDHRQAVRERRDHPGERLVLPVDVFDREFLVLPRVYADPVDHVANHDEVTDRPSDLVVPPEPVGHFRPFVLEERPAPDVDVGHERRPHVVARAPERPGGRDVGPDDGFRDQEPAVVDDSHDADDFVHHDGLRGEGRVRGEEDGDLVRVVFDLEDPVSVLRRPDVGDHADDPHFPRRATGLRDILGAPELAAGPHHVPQDMEPVSEVAGEIGQSALTRRSAGDVPEDPDIGFAVGGLLPRTRERGGQGRARGNRLRRGPDHETGRSLATDLPRALDVPQGEDERRLRACLEERLDTSNRIILGEEELDGVRLEERSVAAYER